MYKSRSTTKAVILARISSREQEQGKSIAAQVENLKRYCNQKDLTIIKSYEVTESSTRGARKRFNELIAYVKEQPEKTAVIADCVDRIQRSFKESVLLNELILNDTIDLHFIREGMVIHKDSKSSDIMLWDFAVMAAKTYILNLRDNVNRSFEFKIKNREYISKAPVGYKNEKDAKGNSTINVDSESAYLVRKAFETYATGSFSLREMTKKLKEWGLTNPNTGQAYHNARIHQMFRDKFYIGIMTIKGEEYPHIYEKFIDEFLFNKCQRVTESHHKKPFKYGSKPFLFRGLIKCGCCGCAISTDRKKDKYNYLFCSKYKGACDSVRVREEEILDQVKDVFKAIAIPKDILSEIQKYLKQSNEAKIKFQKEAIASIRKKSDSLQKKLDTLLDMRLEQSITQSEYDNTPTLTKSSHLCSIHS